MTDISNPHDKFFKEVFSHKDAARDFVIHYLPVEVTTLLDRESLEICKDSYVDNELRQYFSDVLYRARLKEGSEAWLYLLFEHKSYPERLVLFHLLRYMIRIWEQDVKSKRPLCPIVPVVVYHGKEKWTSELHFHSLIQMPKALHEYVPAFHCVLCDLAEYPDRAIQGAVMLKVALLLMKYVVRDDLREKLPGILSILGELEDKGSGLEYLETILRYLASSADNLDKEDFQGSVPEAFFKEGGELMSTLAEKWMQQGKVDESRKVVIEILEIRFHTVPSSIKEAVKEIKDLLILEELRKKALVVDSLAQFETIVTQ